MTFKTSTRRILTYVHSAPMQMSHEISGVTGPKTGEDKKGMGGRLGPWMSSKLQLDVCYLS